MSTTSRGSLDLLGSAHPPQFGESSPGDRPRGGNARGPRSARRAIRTSGMPPHRIAGKRATHLFKRPGPICRNHSNPRAIRTVYENVGAQLMCGSCNVHFGFRQPLQGVCQVLRPYTPSRTVAKFYNVTFVVPIDMHCSSFECIKDVRQVRATSPDLGGLTFDRGFPHLIAGQQSPGSHKTQEKRIR